MHRFGLRRDARARAHGRFSQRASPSGGALHLLLRRRKDPSAPAAQHTRVRALRRERRGILFAPRRGRARARLRHDRRDRSAASHAALLRRRGRKAAHFQLGQPGGTVPVHRNRAPGFFMPPCSAGVSSRRARSRAPSRRSAPRREGRTPSAARAAAAPRKRGRRRGQCS